MDRKATIQGIVDGGYCIGCGACAALQGDCITMTFDRYGMYQAKIHGEMDAEKTERTVKVCPFSDDGPNEDDFALTLFPEADPDERIGRYRGLYIGYVQENDFRVKGSSGGVVSWISAELLTSEMVDGIIHMMPSADGKGGALFSYAVSTTSEEILKGAKSKYYPMELSRVLDIIRKSDKRYALVGVPCFIKAVRRLMLIDPVIAERVKFCIGLVCGHLKSKAFADCLAWQAGILPGQLEKVDFRVKLPNRKASDYGVMLAGNGKSITRPTREFFGSNWGHGFFKYGACECCDDVFAETADISVGDAWLPEYTEDSLGNSLIVVRSGELDHLIKTGIASGRLNIQQCSADKIAETQASGLRHRREGLSYRLSLKEKEGVWAPKKRVPASAAGIGSSRKKTYLLREELRKQSHELWSEAVQANDFSLFQTGMSHLLRQYNHAHTSFSLRVAQKIKRIMRRFKQETCLSQGTKARNRLK